MSNRSEFLVWGSNHSNLLSLSGSKSYNQPHPLTINHDIASICASEKHVSFVTSSGSLYSYGTNLDGRLGLSTKTIKQTTYQQPIRVPLSGKVIRVESGFSHMCALLDNGNLFAWGLGDYGALGNGQFRSCSTPSKVKLPSKVISTLRQISCGAMHTAFLTEEGQLFMCGSNEYGELGLIRPEKIATPTEITFQLPIRQVSCGVFYTLILTKDGRVYGMGNNKYGQLGIGTKSNEYQPTLIRELEGIVKVTAGYHSGAIDRYGNLFIWGSGSFGEFLKPRKYILGVPIKDIAIRGFFGLAIGQNSRNSTYIYAWGNNSHGELGIETYEAAKQPIEIESLRGMDIGKITLGVNFAMMMIGKDTPRSASIKKSTKTQRDYHERSHYPSERRDVASFEEDYLKSNPRRNPDRSVSPMRGKLEEKNKFSEDYRRLFLNLSEDYEVLMSKYNVLQRQLNKPQKINNYEGESIILRQENSQLKRQLAQTTEQLKITMIKLADAEVNKGAISADLQTEYNRLLNQKQQVINRLNITNTRAQQQFDSTIKVIQQENNKRQHRLQEEINIQEKIINDQKEIITKVGQQLEKQKVMVSEVDILRERCLKGEGQIQLLKDKYLKSQQEKSKLVLLNAEMASAIDEAERLNDLTKNYKVKNELLQQQLSKRQVQLGYQIELNKRYNDSVLEFEELREKMLRDINVQAESTKNDRLRIEQLQIEADKGKKYKKESDLKNIQIEEFQQKFDSLKKKTDTLLRQKENQIIQAEQHLLKKTKQFEKQLDNKTNELAEVHEFNKTVERQCNVVKDSLSLTKHEMNILKDQNQVVSQQKAAMEKKLLYVTTELNKQIDEREALIREVGEVKRQMSRLTITNGQLEKNISLEREERQKISKKLERREKDLSEAEDQIEKINEKCQNLRKQNIMNKEALQDANTRLEYQTKVNFQLSEANKQFAENQAEFRNRTTELERKIHELEDENKSYTPRYEALMLRNRQLDERNRELGEMVNKAIEIQAQSYKNNILKEVEFNTDKIINEAKQEQTFVSKERRKKSQPKQTPIETQFYQTPTQTVVKEEPYTKLMKQRISQHKRRVSESAHKLANILDIEESDQRGQHTSRRLTDDYEKINSQMQDFNNQKKNFMAKINSFAEKMKIL